MCFLEHYLAERALLRQIKMNVEIDNRLMQIDECI